MASSAGTAGEQAPEDLAVQVPLILATLQALRERGVPLVALQAVLPVVDLGESAQWQPTRTRSSRSSNTISS